MQTQLRATTVRMPDDLHYHAKIAAATQRMSLSDYIVSLLVASVPTPKKSK